jgi:transcriptional regulator with XRE-family HTH domain
MAKKVRARKKGLVRQKNPDVPRRVRAYREALGLTQEMVARRAKLSAKFISEIENGHTNPSIDTVARLVEHGLGVPLSAFFSESAPSEVTDDLGELVAMFAGQTSAVRKRALRVLKAVCE